MMLLIFKDDVMPLMGLELEKIAIFHFVMRARYTRLVLPHILEASVGVLLNREPLILMKPAIGVFAISIALLTMVIIITFYLPQKEHIV